MHRTYVTLDSADHRRAQRRAAALGISLAEYVRRLVQRDLTGAIASNDPAAFFSLGDSGGSDVSTAKVAYAAEAIADHRRGL